MLHASKNTCLFNQKFPWHYCYGTGTTILNSFHSDPVLFSVSLFLSISLKHMHSYINIFLHLEENAGVWLTCTPQQKIEGDIWHTWPVISSFSSDTNNFFQRAITFQCIKVARTLPCLQVEWLLGRILEKEPTNLYQSLINFNTLENLAILEYTIAPNWVLGFNQTWLSECLWDEMKYPVSIQMPGH